MYLEYYKTEIQLSKDLDKSYKLLGEARRDEQIEKEEYMQLHGIVLQAKAEFDRLERQEEIFVEPKEEIDIKELVIAALWKSDEFVKWYPIDEDGHCDGIDTIYSDKVEKFIKEYIKES